MTDADMSTSDAARLRRRGLAAFRPTMGELSHIVYLGVFLESIQELVQRILIHCHSN